MSLSVRKLLVTAVVVWVVAATIKALRGEPAPAFDRSIDVPPDLLRPEPGPGAEIRGEAEISDKVEANSEAEIGHTAETGERSWVEAPGKECPDGFPVKVKLSSGIYHLPGMAMYERTSADRCYRSADDAEADGFRASKR